MKKSLLKFVFLAMLAVFMTGCSVLQRLTEEPQERIVYKFVPVPAAMAEKVQVPVPPHPEAYSTLPWGDQEDVLVKLLQEHTQALGTCNARLYGISDWSAKQYKLYQQVQP